MKAEFADDSLIQVIQKSVNKPEEIVVGGIPYLTREVHIPPPEPDVATLGAHTLSGIVSYVTGNVDALKGAFVHVVAPNEVAVRLPPAGRHQHRPCPIRAATYPIDLSLGKWLGLEAAIINLIANFEPTEIRAALLAVLGNVTAREVGKWADDGVSQTVQTRKGISFQEATPIPSPCMLAPFRTFPEVLQPESLFVVRVKQQESDEPIVALIEADGGAWKNEATENIAEYLRSKLPEIAIIA